MSRWHRPLVWLLTALAAAAAVWAFDRARAEPPALRPAAERADCVLIETAAPRAR